MVVGLTTTELPAALIIGRDGGGVVTEMTGNWTGCDGAAGCASSANACARNSKHNVTKGAMGRPAQQTLRRVAAICDDMETPRVTGPAARHRETRAPPSQCRIGCAATGTPRPTALAHDPGCRQVSWLTGLHLPPPSRDPRSQWTFGGRFAAYSCGGSRSIERLFARTAFPFDPPKGNRHVKDKRKVFPSSMTSNANGQYSLNTICAHDGAPRLNRSQRKEI